MRVKVTDRGVVRDVTLSVVDVPLVGVRPKSMDISLLAELQVTLLFVDDGEYVRVPPEESRKTEESMEATLIETTSTPFVTPGMLKPDDNVRPDKLTLDNDCNFWDTIVAEDPTSVTGSAPHTALLALLSPMYFREFAMLVAKLELLPEVRLLETTPRELSKAENVA